MVRIDRRLRHFGGRPEAPRRLVFVITGLEDLRPDSSDASESIGSSDELTVSIVAKACDWSGARGD
jgi:hypothetical protein